LIEEERRQLGAIKLGEKKVWFVFAITALAWIIRGPINDLFLCDLSNSAIAITGGLSLFLIPNEKSFVLNWKDTEKLPWGILILFGGGLSLAKTLELVGVVQMIGDSFTIYGGGWSLLALIFMGSVISLCLTEVMSNVALVSVFVPVIAGVATSLGYSPIVLTAPVTLAASCAFLLPISTPPNAVVFASGHIKVKDMMKAGLVLNVLAILLVTVWCYLFYSGL
jgi:sodium-dependent dicarboxylate transporter 2/3/5